jgi:hypothetical protein
MARLTDTQLVILSTASRRDDRGVDLPTNVTGEAVRKAVDKLIRTGLLEEVRADGSLLAWRRDAEAGPMALRITKQGLEAIGVKDVAVSAPTEASASPAPDRNRSRSTCGQSRRLPQAGLRCNAGVRSHEASDGQGEDQSWLLARKPARVETSARARHAGAAGGGDDCRHHARHPLAATLGARLLRWRGAQEAWP